MILFSPGQAQCFEVYFLVNGALVVFMPIWSVATEKGIVRGLARTHCSPMTKKVKLVKYSPTASGTLWRWGL